MKDERRRRILEMLAEGNRAEVSDLSEKLGVSQVTIRKDLDELEKQGIIIREKGFATLRSRDDINGRIAYHYEKKLKIAQTAAALVKDGDIIMIESGSCCALLAEALAKTRKDLTVITNSAYIADRIRKIADFDVILLGGHYQKDSQTMVGPMVRKCAGDYYADRFFIGVDGYTDRTGFTNSDSLRAQAVRDMAASAEEVVILTESEKFGTRGLYPLNLIDSQITLISDSDIPESCRIRLEEENVRLVVC